MSLEDLGRREKAMKKVLLLNSLFILVFLTACSGIALDDLQGEWVRIEGYIIDEESEVVALDRISFIIQGNDIIQNHSSARFELGRNQFVIYDETMALFPPDTYELSLNDNVLTINEVDYFLVGSTEYESHTTKWQETADTALYERFAEIWAWRGEVDEVVNEFIETALGIDARIKEELSAMLVSHQWRMYSSQTGGAAGNTTLYDGDGVVFIFLEDGRFIFTGNERNERVMDYFEMILHHVPYEFNLDLETHFIVEYESRSAGWRDFEVITNLELARNLEEITIENRLFLDEIRLEIELLNGTSLADLLASDELSVEFWNENHLIRLRLPNEVVWFRDDEFSSSNSLGGPSGWFVTYRKEPIDANFISGLLAEFEQQAAIEQERAERMAELAGEWVRFEGPDDNNAWSPLGSMTSLIIGSDSSGWQEEDEIHIMESYNPYLCVSGFQGSLGGGRQQHFQLADDGSYIILGARIMGMNDDLGDVGERISFELSTDILIFDSVSYFRPGSDVYHHYRSQFAEQLALALADFDVTLYLSLPWMTQEVFEACLENSEFLN